MKHFLIAPMAAMLVASSAAAQIPATTASGVGSFGGGFRPRTPSLSAPVPLGNRFVPRAPFIRGGFAPGFPIVPHTAFYGGPVFPGFYYPYGYPYYGLPQATIFQEPAPAPAAPTPPARVVELSGESKGTVILQLPQPARVWLDGRELEGGPAREWTLASPVLRPGEEYTLNVVARWEVDGKTYESTNKITVGPGNKSRLGVISGTEVK